jgi:signal transduction histidine kinase
MIRIAAHDLGNPLTSISGYIDMLIESSLEPRELEYAQLVKESAQQMKKIIRNILSLQRIEELAQGNLNAQLDLGDVVKQVCDSQRFITSQRGQILKLFLPESPIIMKGDNAQLREAVVNLVGNAVKYTPNGGTITVNLETDGEICRFEVHDTGFGIPEDQQQRLFQPFYRVKMPEIAAIDGTGLGLHLVKNIIERHGGTMRFESVYGQGSTFGFELPLSN